MSIEGETCEPKGADSVVYIVVFCSEQMTDRDSDSGTKTATKERTKVKQPKQYRVILLNDDYTPMDFVVAVLETIFQKSPAEAVRIMLQVHQQGKGVCGVFSRQIAETKVALVHDRAAESQYPLRCTMEEA